MTTESSSLGHRKVQLHLKLTETVVSLAAFHTHNSIVFEYKDDNPLSPGCLSEEGHLSADDDSTIIIFGRWESVADYDAYIQLRTDTGYFVAVTPMLLEPPQFIHMEKESFYF